MSHLHSTALRGTAASRRTLGNHPMAWAIAVALGSMTVPAAAQQAFSPAWFADKGAAQAGAAQSGRMPNGAPVNFGQPTQQQAAARQKLQQSIDNLGSAAQAIALQQRMQEQARHNLRNAGYVVADGLAEGGLKVDENPLTRGWLNAREAIQRTGSDGRVEVSVEQTADKAILNWETFNIGSNTTLSFGQNADWAVLNRVNDPNARPSQILGQLKAPGSVFVTNRNGVVFGNNSQVNVRNLVAAAARISDSQFKDNGLYSADNATSSLTDALGDVQVERGARITTDASSTATRGGGYVLLAGHSVDNAGQIETGKGQTLLAAGDAFVIRKGVGTAQNTASTTRGNEVAPRFVAGSTAGQVSNTGLIQAREGDITLAGRTVEQAGVVVATTTINQRGSVHLLNSISDRAGSVTLAEGATTAVLIEDDGKTTALDSQRDAMIEESARQDPLRATSNLGTFDNLSRMNDRRDQSRIEIVSGGNVAFEGQSLTLATGGQVVVDAAGRSFLQEGARVDVSGATGVHVSMESNNVKINVQGNELRDSPDNRDSGKLNSLNNNEAWIDRRQLIHVPAGTGGYEADRWYAAGGLLEVGGYLGTQGRSIGEWAAQGGSVLLGGSEVITRAGSNINLAGGSLDVASGTIHQTWLRGNDGQLYRLDDAPAALVYAGLYRGYEVDHARWGVTEAFRNPLIASERRVENGYTIGRDAGQLVISAPTAVLEGSVDTSVFNGVRQQRAPDAALDGLAQAQTAVARGAQLWLGQYGARGRAAVFASQVDIRSRDAQPTPSLEDALDASLVGTVWLDADTLSAQRWGRIDLATAGAINLQDRLTLADGGSLVLTASMVDMDGQVRIAGGQVTAGNKLVTTLGSSPLLSNGGSHVRLGDAAQLDLRGNWVNTALQPQEHQQLAWIDGGSASLENSQDVTLAADSRISVDAGGRVNVEGKATGGKGGSVSLLADEGRLQLGGQVSALGVAGSGTLALASDGVINIGTAGAAEGTADGALWLDTSWFQRGFSRYDINGHDGVNVVDGTLLQVVAPTLQFGADLLSADSWEQALHPWLAPLYAADPSSGLVQQRAGASLVLRSSWMNLGGSVRVGNNAQVQVDSGHSIEVLAGGNIDIDGRLQAHGGRILLDDVRHARELYNGQGSSLRYRIGRDAVLDVSADSHAELDSAGSLRGTVRDGGLIGIGGELDWEESAEVVNRPPDAFIVIEKGAVLDASGTQVELDIDRQGRTAVASDAGTIVLRSANGLHLDGDLRAFAGGMGAQGGTLGIALGGALYSATGLDADVRAPRVLSLTQHATQATPEPATPTFGQASLAVDQINAGGFDHLSVFGDIRADASFTLSMGQSLRLHALSSTGVGLGLSALAPAGSLLTLSAPYVRLAQAGYPVDDRNGVVSGQPAPVARDAGHTLKVTGSLVDVRDTVNLQSFDHAELSSTGDMRLQKAVVGIGANSRTVLIAPSVLDLTAAQLYGGGDITVGPGVNTSVWENPEGLLRVHGLGGSDLPAVPLTLGGGLTLIAAKIEQGGIIRAPLGGLSLGGTTLDGLTASSVTLLPGSITSTSGAGLTLPGGGTTDGLEWWDGDTRILSGEIGSGGGPGRGTSGVTFTGSMIDVQAGAVVDISGGGEVTGAGYVSGRGGSVDVRTHALADANPAYTFSDTRNEVYAILPGYGDRVAPSGMAGETADPRLGQRITVPEGVPGLAAGTYTLLPASFALQQGAFRVELGHDASTAWHAPAATGTGSWRLSGQQQRGLGSATSPLYTDLVLTPAAQVRRHSGYNETGYNAFAQSLSARGIGERKGLTADAGDIKIALGQGAGLGDSSAFTFNGSLRMAPASSDVGLGGEAWVSSLSGRPLEILAAGQRPISTEGAAVFADALTALKPSSLIIGSPVSGSPPSTIVVRDGATLAAPEVQFQISPGGKGLTIEQGATITTVGFGPAPYDQLSGRQLGREGAAMFALSNAQLNLVPGKLDFTANIDIGSCLTARCDGETRLLTEGSLLAMTEGTLRLGDAVSYGARHLGLGVASINLGSEDALASAAGNAALPPGFTLNQQVLQQLLRGNTALGTPALETLSLTARDAINVYGSVDLDTRNPATGRSSLDTLVLGAPAIHGYGSAQDRARIFADSLIWDGTLGAGTVLGDATTQPIAAPIAGQLGSGQLDIVAGTIALARPPLARQSSEASAHRQVLGFSALNLTASESVSFAGKGSLDVHQQRGEYLAGSGWQDSGGQLNIVTPLLTGAAGAQLDIRSGGDFVLTGHGTTAGSDVLGAQLGVQAQNIHLDSRIALASGAFKATAEDSVTLGTHADLDLSGRKVTLMDVDKYSWGGDVELAADSGDVVAEAGSRIDVSARNNRGGRISVTALGEGAGHVNLAGTLLGQGSGRYDAGGSRVPFDGGELFVRAQSLQDFAGLNQRLTEGGITGTRSFQLKQGDLVVGDEVKARNVVLSVDGGSLRVQGRIDASGEQVGSIRLRARDLLQIDGALDAHGSQLRVDSYGKIIESPNRAIVELGSSSGSVVLGSSAHVDLRSGTDVATGNAAGQNDGKARGTLKLDVPRIGGNDAGITTQAGLRIDGAADIQLNAFRRYDNAPLAATPDVSGHRPQEITQGWMDSVDLDSQGWMNAALANTGLRDRAAALGAYRLRPGVEVVGVASTENPEGDLTVRGDIDLSGYRYGPEANRSDPARRGFGESGALVLRAEGDLNVYGSINDGFAPPPATPDDAGWVLGEAKDGGGTPMTPLGGDIIVPIDGVTLEAGTTYKAGVTLNYAIPFRAIAVPAGTVLPTEMTLAGTLQLPTGMVLPAAVRTADGTVFAAGSVLQQPLQLGIGATLGAGFTLNSQVQLGAQQWPAGVALPAALTLSNAVTLKRGALIPSMTSIQLAGDLPVNLRPVDADGRQARNWAVAAMLPEGTTSWDLTAVAGADLNAADPRQRRYGSTGDIVLADTHYGVIGRIDLIGQQVITKEASLYWWGDESMAGTSAKEFAEMMGMSEADFCAMQADFCIAAPRTITVAASLYWWGDESMAGTNAKEFAEMMGMSEQDFCAMQADFCEGGDMTAVATYAANAPAWSVVRTGRGDMQLLAARDVRMMSAYGVYTAGTPTSLGEGKDAAFDSARGLSPGKSALLGPIQEAGDYDAALAAWQAWYPDHGGNLLVSAGRDLRGDVWTSVSEVGFSDQSSTQLADHGAGDVGNWLWRQGTGNTAGVNPAATSWWINFGAYSLTNMQPSGTARMVGFTGFGTLGGGNLRLEAGRDAGVLNAMGGANTSAHSSALVAAVGSTGRVSDGELHLTGGGDLSLRLGGGLNPDLKATSANTSANNQNSDLNGSLTNLRGHLGVDAARIGGITFAANGYDPLYQGLRREDPDRAQQGEPMGGPVLVLGDSVTSLQARGDVVLAGTVDAGRVPVANYVDVGLADGTRVAGTSWFSLWTANTSVDLVSAGGDVTPGLQGGTGMMGNTLTADYAQGAQMRYWVYPAQLRMLAASGSIRLRSINASGIPQDNVLLTAPSATGVLEVLAMDSIYAPGSAAALSSSGADTRIPTPFDPAFVGESSGGEIAVRNTSDDGALVTVRSNLPLFAFGANRMQVNDLREDGGAINRFYAATGDILGLKTGGTHTLGAASGVNRTVFEWTDVAAPVSVKAGRDIIAGDIIGLNNTTTDISTVQAGRDIIHTQISVAGPGDLEVSAGRQIRQEDKASITTTGSLVQGDTRPGASISVTAGNEQLDYAALRARYLDPTNLADPELTLAEQPGKAVKLYGTELEAWLQDRFGVPAKGDAALALFDSLPEAQQRIFLRQVYHAELRAGGREYNDPDSPRFGSYLRGREAIATLLPEKDASGATIDRTGDIVMFGASGVRTQAGGNIDLLAPGGQIVVGVQGEVPPASAGVVTQGQGDIRMFSDGSLLLGLSRVMTTFGGDIQAWSARGDINAGRGALTSVQYTPALRVYDQWGNVNLSPQAPATGAGIATLAPIAEVPAGDVDLIAPLGTIDAGEAGIRVSGNVNLAALQVLNAANVQVQGESTGLPVLATVNVNALSSASAAANSASQAAQDVMRKTQDDARKNRPSEISVQVLGFGASSSVEPKPKVSEPVSSYDPNSAFQFPQAEETVRR